MFGNPSVFSLLFISAFSLSLVSPFTFGVFLIITIGVRSVTVGGFDVFGDGEDIFGRLLGVGVCGASSFGSLGTISFGVGGLGTSSLGLFGLFGLFGLHGVMSGKSSALGILIFASVFFLLEVFPPYVGGEIYLGIDGAHPQPGCGMPGLTNPLSA